MTIINCFWLAAILAGIRWTLVVFICIALMTGDVKHIFMCLLAVRSYSFENIHSVHLLTIRLTLQPTHQLA